MDDEDMADAEDGRRVQTAEGFGGLGSTQDDAHRRGAWIDLFRVEGETVGVKLLKKMGWKEGQGVGPKVRRKARLEGPERPGDDASATTHLFAPENTRMVRFVRKNDRKGLGFEGETKLSSSNRTGSDKAKSDDEEERGGFLAPQTSKIKKKPIRGGIGIGILNDTGSDDEDPYEIGPRISYNKVIGGDKKKKKVPKSTTHPLLSSKPVFISKKTALAKATLNLRKCHDGRLPLDGFVLSSKDEFSSVTQPASDGIPQIPEGWVSSKIPKSGSANLAYRSTAEAAKASKLDPKSRASMLGEAALPGKSVFDFLTPAARDRLVSASGRSNLPAALGEVPKGYGMTDEERQREFLAQIPKVDKDTADAALSRGASGFMPYGEDEAKRTRYRAYLEHQAGLSPALPEKPPRVSPTDWLKELREFANCAQIFKPMSGMMATRFTSSTSAPKLASSDAPDASLLSKPAPRAVDPAEQAAQMGMYGPMTRSTAAWYPSRLLCKRFNVKPPAHVQPGATEHGQRESAAPPRTAPDVVSQEAIDEMMRESYSQRRDAAREDGRLAAEVDEVPPEHKRGAEEVVVDAERNEALEGEKAGAAVFKAIFGDDSDED